MNQRDQNQGSGKRGGNRHPEASASGRQQERDWGGYTPPDRMQQERMQQDREWESQQRGSRMSGSSAGQRFGETYNPEPQWLRDDRDQAASEYRSSSDYSGRGSYAGSGSPWGEQQGGSQGGFRGESGYGSQYGGRAQRDYPGYGAQGSEESGAQPGSRYGFARGGFGGPDYGSSHEQRSMGGRGMPSGYGASRGGGMHEYGTPGYETAGYDSDLGYSGQSMSGRGYGSQYRSGSSTGYGSGGYGSSSGYQLGTHQGDTGFQRSYRGMGPQDYKRPDDRIRDDVYERLTDSHEIDARGIMVEVNQGNVTLTGSVPERQMRYAAEDLVEACMGVSNINNQLKVQAPQSTSGTSSGTGASATSTSTESKRH